MSCFGKYNFDFPFEASFIFYFMNYPFRQVVFWLMWRCTARAYGCISCCRIGSRVFSCRSCLVHSVLSVWMFMLLHGVLARIIARKPKA